MQRVKTPWKSLSIASLAFFGVPFTVIGIFMYIIIENLAFLINGFFWICMGLGLAIFDAIKIKKESQIIARGSCYVGTIIEVKVAHLIKIGSYVTTKVVCCYAGKKGEKTTESGYCLLSPLDKKEDYTAKVYVDEVNDKHYVEILKK